MEIHDGATREKWYTALIHFIHGVTPFPTKICCIPVTRQHEQFMT